MYLHLGKNTVVKSGGVIGIFDLETSTVSKHTRDFLAKSEKEKRVVNVSYELPRSFVLTGDGNGTKSGRDKKYVKDEKGVIDRKAVKGKKDGRDRKGNKVGKDDSTVYISPLSTLTLRTRAKNKGLGVKNQELEMNGSF